MWCADTRDHRLASTGSSRNEVTTVGALKKKKKNGWAVETYLISVWKIITGLPSFSAGLRIDSVLVYASRLTCFLCA